VNDAGTSEVGLRARIALAWSSGSRRQRAGLLVSGMLAAGLGGAFLFGAWHVLFGGFVKGNWRAGAFGIALAAVSGIALGIEAAVLRMRERQGRSRTVEGPRGGDAAG
jgi:Zn-dependent protease with chaperone function